MIKAIMTIAAALLLVSCSSDDKGTDPGGGSNTTSTDYYPLATGNVWYYTQYRDGVASGTRTRQIIGEATLPDGTTVLEQGSKLQYVRKTEHALLFYYDLTDNDADCSWPWPFAVGNQVVDCHFDNAGEIRNGVFATMETITVPAGTFECYRLDWPDFTQWFAPGVGLVKYREQYDHVREDRLDSCSLK